jgi:hypothetical protein
VVERYIKTADEQLRKIVASNKSDWDARSPHVLLPYRVSADGTAALTPASLVFSRELRLPNDLIFGTPPEKERPRNIMLQIWWTIGTKSLTMPVNTCSWPGTTKTLFIKLANLAGYLTFFGTLYEAIGCAFEQ